MRKWKLILLSCIMSLVLLFPVYSRADLILSVQPYVGGTLEAGERFVVDVLWFNYKPEWNTGFDSFFIPTSGDFTIHYDSGIDYIPSSASNPTYTAEPDNNVNVSVPYAYIDPYSVYSYSTWGTQSIVVDGQLILLATLFFDTINPGIYYIGISNADPNEGIWGIYYGGLINPSYSFVQHKEYPYTYITVGGSPSTPVPEPTTMLLLGLGLIGLAGVSRKFKQ